MSQASGRKEGRPGTWERAELVEGTGHSSLLVASITHSEKEGGGGEKGVPAWPEGFQLANGSGVVHPALR